MIVAAPYVHVTTPITVFSESFVLGLLTVTGLSEASLTVVAYGRLSTFTLFTEVAPPMFVVQLLKVCAVSDSVAVPGAAGFLVTLEVREDLLYSTPVVVPGLRIAFVPA